MMHPYSESRQRRAQEEGGTELGIVRTQDSRYVRAAVVEPEPTPLTPPPDDFALRKGLPFAPVAADSFAPVAADPFTPTAADPFAPTAADPFAPAVTDPFAPTAADLFAPTAADPFAPPQSDQFEGGALVLHESQDAGPVAQL